MGSPGNDLLAGRMGLLKTPLRGLCNLPGVLGVEPLPFLLVQVAGDDAPGTHPSGFEKMRD